MSKEYEIEVEYFTYHVEAEPVIEDESFDHAFGYEKRFSCTDVKIDSAQRQDNHTGNFLEISDKEFRADVEAFEDLLEQVAIDWAGGVFDD